MLAKPGLRILAALMLVVVALLAALLAVGTEESGGLVTQRLQPALPQNAPPYTSAKPSRETRRPAPPAMPMADEPAYDELYEPDVEEPLVDEATGIDPSADVPPEPMLDPEGFMPEPMSEPDAAFGA
jgi:hypothetical protein